MIFSRHWRAAAAGYLDRRALLMFFLGIAAGIPILLIFSTLSLWLREAGVSRATVTMFSWAALAYSFKFIWAPLIDALSVPVLHFLGKRRSWLLFSQLCIIAAIITMANINPISSSTLTHMALAAVFLGFASATQDIVIDAYRIEIAGDNSGMQSITSAMYVAGYRVGMLIAGAGTLFLAAKFGSNEQHYVYSAWQNSYYIIAAAMNIGVITTLLAPEPVHQKTAPLSAADSLKILLLFVSCLGVFIGTFLSISRWFETHFILVHKDSIFAVLNAVLREGLSFLSAGSVTIFSAFLAIKCGLAPRTLIMQTWIEPIASFFARYGKKALILLALIGIYRIADMLAGVMSNVFFQDMGFSKEQIATAVKIFGVFMAISGGFYGGLLVQRFPLMKMMTLGAVLTAGTNLLFVLLAFSGNQLWLLYVLIAFDNFAAGMANTIFVAFLSALTDIRFTAAQYAMFSSLMTLLPKILGGYSGAVVEHIGYPNFFLLTAGSGLFVLALLYFVAKWLPIRS
ncbi:AmpG family muropeptide MFS transporter [Dichelobacter nodosus]|uniref:AmpG family permaese n=1 Tax=Dichelobacter nodosus (strain VCS1703A) TaxID=246195 RepID=A5EX46_DICNV|nr:MFS transporter [Dichelobacter nodosus]ABQ13960.1 AmpG family permaese [Dichelobacter nodosus VCS1703A]